MKTGTEKCCTMNICTRVLVNVERETTPTLIMASKYFNFIWPKVQPAVEIDRAKPASCRRNQHHHVYSPTPMKRAHLKL